MINSISSLIHPITSSTNCQTGLGSGPSYSLCGAHPSQLPLYPFAAEKTRTMMPITARVVNPIVAIIDISIQYLPYMIIAIVRTGARDVFNMD